MTIFLKLLWRFRWQVIVGLLLSTVLAQQFLARGRNHLQPVPDGDRGLEYVRVEPIHPRDPEGDKLRQSTLECIDLKYYVEGDQNLQKLLEEAQKAAPREDQHLYQQDSGTMLTQEIVDSIPGLGARLGTKTFRPLLERTRIEIEDIALQVETRLDRDTGKVDNTVVEVDRRKVWFPQQILLGPRLSRDEIGEKLSLHVAYRPGHIRNLHFECSGDLFHYQSINDSLPEDLIEHFDGVSYEVSCAALYRIR